MPNSQPLILGTAGHIDHGKSSLIRRLTGVDPDRLAEEKRRGITIELGFAELITPNDIHFGVVDVPGHEKFVRHMVAGAAGIDIALLVIAADDGVMVQTREHVEILRLLGIEHALVALTKVDLVDKDWLGLVTLDVESFLAETPFAGAPIVPVSSETGEGLDVLLEALEKMGALVAAEKRVRTKGSFRLPIDRVFHISGAGTVVTGTLLSGSVKVDDIVTAALTGTNVRVRSMQVHGVSVDLAQTGQRVALNVVSPSKEVLTRGEMLVTPDSITPSNTLNVRLSYSGSGYGATDAKPLKNGTRVHVHHGTAEILGTIHLFGEKVVNPGEETFAQLRLEKPIPALIFDRFVIRSFSPASTVGGGTILDPHASRRARITMRELDLLEALYGHELEKAIQAFLDVKSLPLTSAQVAHALGVERATVADILNRSTASRIKVSKETYFVAPEVYNHTIERIETALLAMYEEDEKARDFSLAAVKDRVDARLEQPLFEAYVHIAAEKAAIVLQDGRLRHTKAAGFMHALEDEMREKALARVRSQGLAVETLFELADALGYDRKIMGRVLNESVSSGDLVRIAGEFYFSKAALDNAADIVRAALLGKDETNPGTIGELKDALGVSRKYVVPLLEYFDACRLTKRSGEGRVLL